MEKIKLTNAGIQTIETPDQQTRIIPASVRPDGTVRKVRQVRPGFTPAEDIQLYRPPVSPPTSLSSPTRREEEMPKAQKKNVKRQEKKHLKALHELLSNLNLDDK
jgi:hypothetical protein